MNKNGLFLENRHLNNQAKVNGKTAIETQVKDSDQIEINSICFTYKAKNGEKNENKQTIFNPI